jgi:hypothetical protein
MTDDTLPFSPAERRRLKQGREEAAQGETTEGTSFFAGLQLTVIYSIDEVPDFDSDMEAASFWDTHTCSDTDSVQSVVKMEPHHFSNSFPGLRFFLLLPVGSTVIP